MLMYSKITKKYSRSPCTTDVWFPFQKLLLLKSEYVSEWVLLISVYMSAYIFYLEWVLLISEYVMYLVVCFLSWSICLRTYCIWSGYSLCQSAFFKYISVNILFLDGYSSCRSTFVKYIPVNILYLEWVLLMSEHILEYMPVNILYLE